MKHMISGIAAACIAILSAGAEASQPASQPSHGSAASVPVGVTTDAIGRIMSVTTPEGTTSYRYFEGTNEPLIQEVTKPDGTREQYTLDVATSAYHALLESTATSNSNSNPCSGANRFGFNGYLWECELGSYLTPSGRLYDPVLGRFLQQDAYLGDIANPPSLHRYTFGHNNPTSFVDPTGHESYRQWILLDKPTTSVGHEFLKHLGYNAFNLASFGALARQDTLVEQSEAGSITEGQYERGTGASTSSEAARRPRRPSPPAASRAKSSSVPVGRWFSREQRVVGRPASWRRPVPRTWTWPQAHARLWTSTRQSSLLRRCSAPQWAQPSEPAPQPASVRLPSLCEALPPL
jgi:RHS repeat-associated protein